ATGARVQVDGHRPAMFRSRVAAHVHGIVARVPPLLLGLARGDRVRGRLPARRALLGLRVLAELRHARVLLFVARARRIVAGGRHLLVRGGLGVRGGSTTQQRRERDDLRDLPVVLVLLGLLLV